MNILKKGADLVVGQINLINGMEACCEEHWDGACQIPPI